MTDLKRRSFLSAGLGLAAAGSLAACSRGGSSDSGSGDTATQSLRVAWYGGQPVTDGLTAALDAYTSANTGVTIEPESAPFDDFFDRLATQTAGGEMPDVMRMSMSFYADYAARDSLLDVTELTDSGAIDTSGLDADVVASGEVAGGTFGVGQSSIAYAIFVDPVQLESAGLAVPQIGWTWDDFTDLATAYAAAGGDGVYGVNDNGGVFQAFDVFSRQHGQELFTPDGGLSMDGDTIAEWFAMWELLRQDGVAPPPDVTSETAGFENALIVKGSCAMQWGWVQQVTFYQPLTQAPLQIVSIPTPTQGDLSAAFIKALDFWCISATTADPEGAAAVVDFLLNDPTAIESIGLTLGVPASQAARDLLAADPESAEGRAIAYVETLADQVGPPPPAWPVGYSEIQAAFARANEQIAFGEQDPSTGAATVMGVAEGVLAG